MNNNYFSNTLHIMHLIFINLSLPQFPLLSHREKPAFLVATIYLSRVPFFTLTSSFYSAYRQEIYTFSESRAPARRRTNEKRIKRKKKSARKPAIRCLCVGIGKCRLPLSRRRVYNVITSQSLATAPGRFSLGISSRASSPISRLLFARARVTRGSTHITCAARLRAHKAEARRANKLIAEIYVSQL